jgi:hypothetical protein
MADGVGNLLITHATALPLVLGHAGIAPGRHFDWHNPICIRSSPLVDILMKTSEFPNLTSMALRDGGQERPLTDEHVVAVTNTTLRLMRSYQFQVEGNPIKSLKNVFSIDVHEQPTNA